MAASVHTNAIMEFLNKNGGNINANLAKEIAGITHERAWLVLSHLADEGKLTRIPVKTPTGKDSKSKTMFCLAERNSEMPEIYKVGNQKELDEAIQTIGSAEGGIEVTSPKGIWLTLRAPYSVMVILRENSMILAFGESHVRAMESTFVCAFDSSRVRAHDNSMVSAFGHSHVSALDKAHVVSYDETKVVAYDQVTFEANGFTALHVRHLSRGIANDDVTVTKLDHAMVEVNDRARLV